ncbi:MAG: TadE/TadG family type IV pilus assembly protein [Galactobacter sp.]
MGKRVRWCECLRWCRSRVGSVPVEAVVIVPLFLAVAFTAIQVGMYFHAKNVAHSAASAGYNESRLEGAQAGDGSGAARNVLGRNSGALKSPGVSVSKGGQSVSVTVTGRGPSLVPFWSGPQITETVSGPNEKWVSR